MGNGVLEKRGVKKKKKKRECDLVCMLLRSRRPLIGMSNAPFRSSSSCVVT